MTLVLLEEKITSIHEKEQIIYCSDYYEYSERLFGEI